MKINRAVRVAFGNRERAKRQRPPSRIGEMKSERVKNYIAARYYAL